MLPITFVSFLFDIGRSPEAQGLNFSQYIEKTNALLSMTGLNFYFITTKDIYSSLIKGDHIFYKIVKEIPNMEWLPKFEKVWESYNTKTPLKDNPMFAVLTTSKFNAIKMAIADDPFKTEHFAWIDAGILKIVKEPELIYHITPSQEIKCMFLNYVSSKEIRRADFYLSCWYKIAAGFFVGNKENMLWLSDAVINLYLELFDQNIGGLEQEYLATVYREHPERFEPYFGDFPDLICNYQERCNNKWLADRFLKEAIKNNDKLDIKRCLKFLRR